MSLLALLPFVSESHIFYKYLQSLVSYVDIFQSYLVSDFMSAFVD